MKDAQRISEIISRIHPTMKSGRRGMRLLRDRWVEVVGDRLSAHTEPRGVRRETLMVSAEGPSWATELMAASGRILAEVRRIPGFKGIERVRISTRKPWKKGGQGVGGGKSNREKDGPHDTTQGVEEEDLEDSLKRLMGERRAWEQRKQNHHDNADY